MAGPIRVAAYPSGGMGVALDPNGSLPQSVRQTVSGYRLDYVKRTTALSVTATTIGTAQTVIASNPILCDGTDIAIKFFACRGTRGTTSLFLELFEDTTDIGQFTQLNQVSVPLPAETVWTPTAGLHTYTVKAYVDAGTGTVSAGVGGAGTDLAAFLRITKH